MPDFNDFLTLLKANLVTFGRREVEEHAEALFQDGQDFAQQAEADLKQWTGALAAGGMTGSEFRLAVRGRAELAQMEALKQAGLAAIRCYFVFVRFASILAHVSLNVTILLNARLPGDESVTSLMK